MPVESRRDRIISALWDGLLAFGGETLSVTGESLRGTPGYAISVPWRVTRFPSPHRRCIGEWLDRLTGRPFTDACESCELVRFLASVNAYWVPQSARRRFASFRRTYGAWRSGATTLVLSISVVVPRIEAALMWGVAFRQLAIHSLAERKDIVVGHEVAERGLRFPSGW